MGYFILGVIGFLALMAGMFIMRSTIFEFTSGSKEKNLYKKWLHTRRVGLCIGARRHFYRHAFHDLLDKRKSPSPLYPLADQRRGVRPWHTITTGRLLLRRIL